MLILSINLLNGEDADSVRSYLWGLIQFIPEQKIHYEPGYNKDRILHRREFHEPVSFLPVEVRYGVYFLGGGNDQDVSSSWIKYEENVKGFDGGDLQYRIGHQLDIDIVKTNLFYKVLKASWLDMHTGLNLRYSDIFSPGSIDQISSWGNVKPSWDTGSTRFAPRVLSLGISHTTMFQWFEPWYIDSRYTWGYATSSLYMDNKDKLMPTPSASGPSMSISIGPRYIIDLGHKYGDERGKKDREKHNRFSVGLDFRYSYTKLNNINDPDELSPIKEIHLQDLGVHITFSVIYGGALTTGDQGKDYYFRGDYVSAKDYFETFIEHYPEHANRKKAEMYLEESKKKIPLQLYKEGLQFEQRGLTEKSIKRFIEARLRAKGETRILIQEKLDHIAILEIEKAELLASQGKSEEAIKLMKAIRGFSKEAAQKIPIFEAMKLYQDAETALKYGFYSKCLELLDLALIKDKNLEFQVNTLRYQVATHLVEMANQIDDHSELRSAIQLLVEASELSGGLGKKNEKILSELKEKFNLDQQREITGNINKRMGAARVKEKEKISKQKLTVGMTIPDIQHILGNPKNIIEQSDPKGSDIQLWIYSQEDGVLYLLTDYFYYSCSRHSK
jgi:hypothetical protein